MAENKYIISAGKRHLDNYIFYVETELLDLK